MQHEVVQLLDYRGWSEKVVLEAALWSFGRLTQKEQDEILAKVSRSIDQPQPAIKPSKEAPGSIVTSTPPVIPPGHRKIGRPFKTRVKLVQEPQSNIVEQTVDKVFEGLEGTDEPK